jgi:hypothetical protein
MLNEEEKTAIRYYLGYPQVSTAAALSLGNPDKTQLNFILEFNMQHILPRAEKWIRRCLQELQCIEDQLSTFRGQLPIRGVVGSVQLRAGDALEELEQQYRHWVGALTDVVGAPENPFSNRLRHFGGGGNMVQESYP